MTVDTEDSVSYRTDPMMTVVPSYLAVRCLKSCLADKTRRRSSLPLTVRFDKVEFREYGIILGVNPCPSSGPPISLGWAYDPEDTLESDIDSYEADRVCSGGRRTKCELRIPREMRVDMLFRAGHTAREILSAEQGARESQERRNSSLRYRKYDIVVEGAETLKRGLLRMKIPRRTRDGRRRGDLKVLL